MIVQHQITDSAWTAISTVGQSGAAWIDDDLDGCETEPDIRIYHATSAPSVEATVGKRVLRTKSNSDVLLLTADSSTDIFYVKAMPGRGGLLSVDMVS